MNLTSAPAGRAAPGNGQPGVRSWLLGINPAAKLIAACVISFGLIPAVDPVTGGIVLAVTALLLPFSGINRATLLVLSVMPTLLFQVNRRAESQTVRRITAVFVILFSAFMVIGRLVAGVHWLTDIVGSVLLSAGLYCLYRITVTAMDHS